MTFEELVHKVDDKIGKFDFLTLKDHSTDPFLMIAMFSPNYVITTDTMVRYVARDGSNIHHKLRAQDCVAFAMKIIGRLISQVPFSAKKEIKEHNAHCRGFKLNNGNFVFIMSIAGNPQDAEWVTNIFKITLT